MVFRLTKGNHYIRNFDDKNWVVGKVYRTQKKGEPVVVKEEVLGYYPTLQSAWSGAINMQVLQANKKDELLDIIRILEALKIDVENYEK